MSKKPIFLATHPRACSTAFERVFMTCRDTLQCVHEPFGDAWYFGPERLSDRFENNEHARQATGFAESTYLKIFENIERENAEGRRLFIKDMAQYWIPLHGKPPSIAPSLLAHKRGIGTDALSRADDSTSSEADVGQPSNPTIIPKELLNSFHLTFLIRHPRSSVPSYYRCTVPPLAEVSGFHDFRPEEAGYAELRQLFDYAIEAGLIGPRTAAGGYAYDGVHGTENGVGTARRMKGIDVVDPCHTIDGANGITRGDGIEICLIDADDLLDNPYGIVEAFCRSVGIAYSPGMLKWDTDAHKNYAKDAFAKWPGFHEDALDSTELKPRIHKKAPKTDEELFVEWTRNFGEDGANVIRRTVEENVSHYEYLKQFALKA